MLVKLLNIAQETVITCDQAFLNYKEGSLTFNFIDDQTARDNEVLIKQSGGKTIHSDNTIIVTNLSDFDFVFEK